MTTSGSERIQDIIHGLVEVASARDTADIMDLLNHHPELLTDTVNEVVAGLAGRLEHEDPRSAEFLEKSAAVLRSARAGSIADADIAGLASYRSVKDAITRANDRYMKWLTTGTDSDLDNALSAWEGMLSTVDRLASPEEVGR